MGCYKKPHGDAPEPTCNTIVINVFIQYWNSLCQLCRGVRHEPGVQFNGIGIAQVERDLRIYERVLLKENAEELVQHVCRRSGSVDAVQHKVEDDKTSLQYLWTRLAWM